MDAESDKTAHLYMMKEIKRHYQLPASEEELLSLYHTRLFNQDMTLIGNPQNDDIPFQKLHFYSENAFRFLLRKYDIKAASSDMGLFAQMYLDHHLKYIQLSEGSWEAIQLVKEKKCHCGMISDIDHDYQVRQFEELRLNDVFDSITTSEEVKNYKPKPDIFNVALGRAHCQGKEAMMIGDSYNKDIVGGKNMGMTTIWINRYQNLAEKKDLADYIVTQLLDIIPILDQLL